MNVDIKREEELRNFIFVLTKIIDTKLSDESRENIKQTLDACIEELSVRQFSHLSNEKMAERAGLEPA